MNIVSNNFVGFIKIDSKYRITAFSNLQILMLAKFLDEYQDFDTIVSKLEGSIEGDWFGVYESLIEIVEDTVKLGLLYDEGNPEYEFTLPKKTLISLFKDWLNIKKQNPYYIILFWDNGKYWFEVENKILKSSNFGFVKIKRFSSIFGIAGHTNSYLQKLGGILINCNLNFNEIINLLKNNNHIDNFKNSFGFTIKNELIIIQKPMNKNLEYEFTLSKNTFIQILENWINIKNQDFQLVTLYWDDGKYWFEIEK